LYKDRGCGQVNLDNVDEVITIAGWVDSWRDHGSLLFLDLRDSSGIIQIVFDKSVNRENHDIASAVRNEWVIQVEGIVKKRIEGAENQNISTGFIEVNALKLNILNPSKTPPFEINNESVDETTRLKFRYLDLRSNKMQKNLRLRHEIVLEICNFLNDKDFVHIETPILIKSTPEGARDYVVPSRVHTGEYYALPQSPQQMKQMLMVSGFEKYFQIAKCFRDEDLRADRQPEHTQLDFEMSFVHQEDVLSNCENLYSHLTNKFLGKNIDTPFQRLKYEDSIEIYGTDKPDTRFDLKIHNLDKELSNTQFNVFNNAIKNNGTIRGFSIRKDEKMTRKFYDKLNDFVKENGGAGIIPISIEKKLNEITSEDIKSPIVKFLNVELVKNLFDFFGSDYNQVILISAGEKYNVLECLGKVRNKLAKEFNLVDKEKFNFLFVTDFPLFEFDYENNNWTAMHHVFSSPNQNTIKYLDKDPGKVIGNLFDLVCNGVELGSGSIRIHQKEIQEKVFSIIGYNNKQVKERFGTLLESFDYGAPPHGGMGLGIDRLVSTFLGEESIRDVISFPKTQSASDLLWGAPSIIDNEQKLELKIKNIENHEEGKN
tara:strand:- start:9522 stop:11318 length:1797 start_codon:yes stop_codon:yes gene_type:complete